MTTDEITSYLKMQDRNIELYKGEIARLEKQIEDIKVVGQVFDERSLYNEDMKPTYTKEEICVAYNRMLKYEGMQHREGTLITDTFMEFLIGSHHSLKNI